MPVKGSHNPSTRRAARLLCLARNERDNDGMCRIQLPEVCTGKATQAHHPVAREIMGDDPTLLVAACAACNNKLGDPRKGDPAPTPGTRW